MVYGVLFRPLPFPGADRLVQIVQIMETERRRNLSRGLTPDQFLNLQEHATTLDAVGIFSPRAPHAHRHPHSSACERRGVLPGLFDGIGARALRGRTLRSGDGEPAPSRS